MDPIKTILVIADPTAPDQPAVRKAGIIAAKLHAGIELLACETKSSLELRRGNQLAGGQHPPFAGLQPWLESLAAPLRALGVEVTTCAIKGDPLDRAVLAWMRNSPADMVIKDTHHHTLTKRTFLGNTDWHLIRDCPRPLLLTKPTGWKEPLVLAAAIDPPRKAGQDGLDKRIIECAQAIGRSLHAAVHAVHAYFPEIIAAESTSPEPSFFGITPEILQAEKSLHQSRISSLLAPYGVAPDCVHVDMGFPSDYLPRMAAQFGVDIMVMGAISRSHLKQTIIGSTAERLLEYLPCDILVIKERNFDENLPF